MPTLRDMIVAFNGSSLEKGLSYDSAQRNVLESIELYK